MSSLQHELAPHYGELRRIRTRRQLERSALWAEIGGDVERVLGGLARGHHADARPLAGTLRAVAWNVQRGANLDALIAALRGDPELARADVLLLSEVDVGMGRSGNRDVARELADALGMSYAFAVSYLALEDDYLENPDQTPNTLALAGSAILSRAPILRAVNADLPALRDKFGSSRRWRARADARGSGEKRLGQKRAVIVELATTGGSVVVAQAHLDSTASPRQRTRQLAALLDAADALGAPRLLLGGDLNTTTYNASSPWALGADILHKLVVTGFARTVDNYLTPERRYETPLFELLRARGLAVDGFNARGEGTMIWDLAEPYTLAKVEGAIGSLVTRWLCRRLRPWNGRVAAHLDWFAGRGLAPRGGQVVRPAGARASDHDPIVCDVAL